MVSIELASGTTLSPIAASSRPADMAVTAHPGHDSEYAAVEYVFQIPSTWGGGAGFWFWLENNCQVDVTIDGVSVYQSIPGPGYDSSSGLSVSTRFPQDPYGDACY